MAPDKRFCRKRAAGLTVLAQCHGEGSMNRASRILRALLPLALGIAVLLAWEAAVAAYDIPRFVLPAPSAIFLALTSDFPSLMASLWTTLRITLLAFVLAVASGVVLAVLFSQSRTVEMAPYPYPLVFHVTPAFPIPPLIIISLGFA